MLSIAIILSGNVFAQKPQKPAAATVYEIGKTGPAGGIVFHISDGGGSRVRGHHGLEVAPIDQGSRVSWGCLEIEDITGAEGTVVGTGAQNTSDILAGCTEPGIAAELAANYELNGYTDWFLPSIEELYLIRKNLFPLGRGGFDTFDRGGNVYDMYWSSTEHGNNVVVFSSNYALLQLYQDGDIKKVLGLASVRAIRAF